MNSKEIQALKAAYLLRKWCNDCEDADCCKGECVFWGTGYTGNEACEIDIPHTWYLPDLPDDAADVVNHPEHYTAGGIETIDYMRAKLSAEEFAGYLRGNALKYLSRAGLKNDGIEDLKKGQWYLNRLIEELEENK